MFFIAADLTLYSNPLNRALGTASMKKDAPPVTRKGEKTDGDSKKEDKTPEPEAEPEEEIMIASDMVK